MVTSPIFAGRSPPYLHTDEVATLLNHATQGEKWDARRVRRWLRRAGAALDLPSGEVVTTRDRLRTAYPDIYETILRALPEDADEGD